MSVPKNANKHAVLAKIESGGYGLGPAPGNSDGFHVHEEPAVDYAYQFDGARDGRAAGTGGGQRRDQKAGLKGSTSLVHRVRPAGVAYAAAVRPTVDAFLRAHGMLATLDTSVGAEKITYQCVTDGTWESLALEEYYSGWQHRLLGAYVRKWSHVARGTGIPTWSFDVEGIGVLPVESAFPAVVYPNLGTQPPRAAASILTLQASGGVAFQGKVRESTVTSERELSERTSQAEAAGAHAGFQLGGYTQTAEVLVEATALPASPYSTATQLDPYRAADEGTLIQFVLGINRSVQYKRYEIAVPNYSAQIMECRPDKDGAIRLWQLTVALNPSTETADDGVAAVFD